MSVRITYGIPKDIAILAIISSIYKLEDYQLAEVLESLPESSFRNYIINGHGFSDNNDSQINSVEEFFSGK